MLVATELYTKLDNNGSPQRLFEKNRRQICVRASLVTRDHNVVIVAKHITLKDIQKLSGRIMGGGV